MSTAARSESIDQLNMRRSNLALVLREIIRSPRTRAQLASDIDMTKGAVGNLVSDLADRGLIEVSARAETPVMVGRPGHTVSVVSDRVYGIGISFSVAYIIGVAVDLGGRVIARDQLTLDSHEVPAAELVASAVAMVRGLDDVARAANRVSILGGVAVAVPDLVDPHAGVVRRSPTIGLTDFPLADAIRVQLSGLTLNVMIDNDANFGAIAEARTLSEARGANLLYLTGSIGIGGGIVSDGQLFRGSAGFAGEVGHMVIDPNGKRCTCGNIGCWESEIGLNNFLDMVADEGDDVRDRSVAVDTRFDLIVARAAAGDARTLSAIQHVARYLGLGLSSLLNLFNPDTVILGGYFARLFPYLIQPVKRIIHERVLSDALSECEILPTTMLMYSGAIGAGCVMVDQIIADPTVVPRFASTTSAGTLQDVS